MGAHARDGAESHTVANLMAGGSCGAGVPESAGRSGGCLSSINYEVDLIGLNLCPGGSACSSFSARGVGNTSRVLPVSSLPLTCPKPPTIPSPYFSGFPVIIFPTARTASVMTFLSRVSGIWAVGMTKAMVFSTAWSLTTVTSSRSKTMVCSRAK